MITGFNTDIKRNEKVYHVQTEDKGLQNPCIESLVYVGGEILASKKTAYGEQLKSGVDEKWIAGLMEQQHRTVIAAVKRGRFDTPAEAAIDPKFSATHTQRPPSASDPARQDEKTLDQVIIDYLASEAESEHLELSLLNQCDFIVGQTAELRVSTRRSISQQAVVGAALEVRVISTVEPPRVIFKGKSGPDGVALIRCSIPSFRDGTAAVIISASSPFGNDEVKQLVKRKR